jgi:predicted transcriptional regulator
MFKTGQRVVGLERSELMRTVRGKYERGASIRELADEYGRSYGFIHRLLSESLVELRGRGGVHKAD